MGETKRRNRQIEPGIEEQAAAEFPSATTCAHCGLLTFHDLHDPPVKCSRCGKRHEHEVAA